MSIKVNDGLTRSSRTRAKRRAKGICPDCGGTDRILISRCFNCRIKRNAKRKVLPGYHKKQWEMIGGLYEH